METMRQHVKQIEEEAAKLHNIQSQFEKHLSSEAGVDNADNRSVFVGNVDFSATPEDLQSHFQSCGTINRVTILCDKFTGHPKGYAYIEFADEAAVAEATTLNESLFKERPLKVTPKRKNVPSFMRGGRRGFRGYRPWGRPPRGRFGRRFFPYYRGRGY
eukprot:c180_g1_i2.p1 GENE.c180_g1_i2~~c180_g1_i2.p1  ORF type:complete len:159 (-),score=21.85 c180_g1_i2:77-553(-)